MQRRQGSAAMTSRWLTSSLGPPPGRDVPGTGRMWRRGRLHARSADLEELGCRGERVGTSGVPSRRPACPRCAPRRARPGRPRARRSRPCPPARRRCPWAQQRCLRGSAGRHRGPARARTRRPYPALAMTSRAAASTSTLRCRAEAPPAPPLRRRDEGVAGRAASPPPCRARRCGSCRSGSRRRAPRNPSSPGRRGASRRPSGGGAAPRSAGRRRRSSRTTGPGGAVGAHPGLEVVGDVALAAARPQAARGDQVGQRGVRGRHAARSAAVSAASLTDRAAATSPGVRCSSGGGRRRRPAPRAGRR